MRYRIEGHSREFATPEDINDGRRTAPSKRIEGVIPRYNKRFHGPVLAEEIGLDAIRSECPRFGAWMRRLESLGTERTSPSRQSALYEETRRPWRTCFTLALREHAAMVLRRLAGETANTSPVMTLVTRFGGGKTQGWASRSS